jgi:FAD/FMN-containing dehydrogenase
VIDLSAMYGVQVNATARTAHVQAGATWAEVDRATPDRRARRPGGHVSVTGVADRCLTLGGGLGAMTRAHGLSCDNLRSVEIVTPDGMVPTASRDEHPDLLWATRGGAAGLGVVTSLEFDPHPLGPEVASTLVLYPYEDPSAVLRAWRAWRQVAREAPDALEPEIALWSIAPLPDVPETSRLPPDGRCAIAVMWWCSVGFTNSSPLAVPPPPGKGNRRRLAYRRADADGDLLIALNFGGRWP